MSRKKLCIALAIIFAVNIIIISIVQLAPDADAVAYRQGSTGSVVRQIQTKLKNQAFYFGNIDGIYGRQTTTAVRNYQIRYGLKVDGICGNQTLSALGISAGASSSGSSNVNLLARIISAESRGEPYTGQVAVGAVILNRIKHPSFPNTMAGVIYQPGAFTAVTDGQFDKPVSESAYRAARDAINGWDPSGGAIYYFNPAKATSKWIWSRPLIVVIGTHRFCS
ncbi:MAG: spore cortex-lytic enzyme [Clostridiales bacterium]|nr:spore cortex-lytic enzyme [Clostridiales bacterium]